MAEGTVYLYFATKEAIFAALIVEGWKGVLDEVDGVFRSDCSRPEKMDRFLKRTVAYMATHRGLLRLDALGPGVVERNLEPETLYSFKSALTQRLLESGAVVEAAMELPHGRGVQLLMRTYALTRGLWLSLSAEQDRPSGIPGVFQHTNLSHQLAEALAGYWRGALADTRSSLSVASDCLA